MSYERILVCIDGSEESFNALRGAISLAKLLDAEVFVISVVPVGPELSSALSVFIGLKDTLLKGAEKILKQAEDLAEEEDIRLKTYLEQGEPYQKIVDTAYVINADLIVLGKTGKTALGEAIIGSTAVRTIGSSPVDVLVIPKERSLKLKRILVPVDGSEYADRAVLRAIELGKIAKGTLYLLNVIEIPLELFEGPGEIAQVKESLKLAGEEIVRKLKRRVKEEGLEVESYVVEGIIEEEILRIGEEKECDLIVMGSHGKTGIKRFLMGSVTERVIKMGNKPVLVVK